PLANQLVSAADFEDDRVPAHLRMNFRAVDERGRIVGSDRDLSALQTQLADRARSSIARSIAAPPRRPGPSKGPQPTAVATSIEKDGLTTWTFGDLPEVLDTRVAGGLV
ncbi:DUF3418 domain-containing protein, partial [Pseudomonas sp. BGM005]|nr:DUF3418 domain-containing protein [Pseudomonas sp. BG5]